MTERSEPGEFRTIHFVKHIISSRRHLIDLGKVDFTVWISKPSLMESVYISQRVVGRIITQTGFFIKQELVLLAASQK